MTLKNPAPGTIGTRAATGEPVRWDGARWVALSPAARYAHKVQADAAPRWVAAHCTVRYAR